MGAESQLDIWRADSIAAICFEHYYQQISHILSLKPRTVLEIGPGDYTITDFLRRRGIVVKTFDREDGADYVGDMRAPPNIPETFDLILASEVFEHVKFHYLDGILGTFKANLKADGKFLISLPYTTVRLFPKSKRYGRIVSCEGRLITGIPSWAAQPFATLLRGFRRLLQGYNPRKAFEYYVFPEYPDETFNRHHWDAGAYPTTRRRIREVIRKHFAILDEVVYLRTNCLFLILGQKGNSTKEKSTPVGS